MVVSRLSSCPRKCTEQSRSPSSWQALSRDSWTPSRAERPDNKCPLPARTHTPRDTGQRLRPSLDPSDRQSTPPRLDAKPGHFLQRAGNSPADTRAQAANSGIGRQRRRKCTGEKNPDRGTGAAHVARARAQGPGAGTGGQDGLDGASPERDQGTVPQLRADRAGREHLVEINRVARDRDSESDSMAGAVHGEKIARCGPEDEP